MALLAETLVDEWLNRQGYFTVRGLKGGLGEIDLLGVRSAPSRPQACHVEVQTSFRPVGYIAPLLDEDRAGFAKSKTSAKARPEALVRRSVEAWVAKKFTAPEKAAARERAWPGLTWRLLFVHAVVREPLELAVIAEHGVEVLPFHAVLRQLRHAPDAARGSAGTDLSEIIEYSAEHGVR